MSQTTDVAQNLKRLRDQVRQHNHSYHVLDAPDISDEDYDALMRELVALEAEHPELIAPDSPTQRVGGEPLAGFETARHLQPMLSLASSPHETDLRAFDERLRRAVAAAGDETPVTYSLEPKIDGLSVELVYENGLLVRAVTRGDGEVGEVITPNVRTIRSVPLSLRGSERPLPELLAVRGEIFLPIDSFDDVNAELIAAGKQPFANPRNAAAGSVRQLDSTLTASRPLAIYCYDVLSGAGDLATQSELLTALAGWGLPINPGNGRADDVEGVIAYFEEMVEQRDELRYEVDGVVVKLEQLAIRDRLGTTAHHPRWAFAVKFEPRREVSELLRIITSVGRTGVVTPVALLRPVNIGGVTVSRANLHNIDDIVRKDIRVGDKVRVERAGDVIPQVIERVETADGSERGEPFIMPTHCPSCGTTLIRRGPYTVCPNAFQCPAQLVGRLVHYGSRAGLDIEGLGERTATQLVERGLVERFHELYDLTPEQLAELDGFAERSAEKLWQAVDDSRRPQLERFLYALGIPEVGAAVARTLARHFGTFQRLRGVSPDDLLLVDGVGEIMAQQINGFFNESHNVAELDALLDGRVEPRSAAVTAPSDGGTLDGLTFVFTGSLSRLTREQAAELVQSVGGRAVNSVSKRTNYVVAGESAGSKLSRAEELELKILSEDEFLTLLNEQGVAVELNTEAQG